jgi:phosphotransacetylase
MLTIKSFNELTNHLKETCVRQRLVIVNPSDKETFDALQMAIDAGFVSVYLLGDPSHFDMQRITNEPHMHFIECCDINEACELAVAMVKNGEGDILMKGLVNTDILLRSVLNKEKGLVPYGRVVTFIAAVEIPSYSKILFMTDPAVIPAPNIRQRRAMIDYSIQLSTRFGIATPKIALLHGTEKLNPKLNFMSDYQEILTEAGSGRYGNAIIDGPLDVYLALNPLLGSIKQVNSPIQGDADVLVFPNFESANVFYKTVVTFAGAQMGGLLFGTDKPVVLTSRSDTAQSKFNSIACASLSVLVF